MGNLILLRTRRGLVLVSLLGLGACGNGLAGPDSTSTGGGTPKAGGGSALGTGGGTAGAGGGAARGGGDGGGQGGGASGSGGGSAGAGGGNAATGGGGALLPPGQAFFFVSPEGSDENSGTEASPFKTITKARDAVRKINGAMSGDIYVYLRGGDHRLSSPLRLEASDSGTNGHTVHYEAYPGEQPILNGATKVTGWTQHTSTVYKATLSRTTKLRNLYVNDERAKLTSKTMSSKGTSGTYSVTSGQAAWAWMSGSNSDGIKYSASDLPAIASNKDDLEVVNHTTWNENIVCSRDVITTSDNNRALLLQQPYGAIAQLPGWGAGFSTSGTHTVYNAFEFLSSAGQFFFDKTTKTLYYYPKPGEDMATASVEAPTLETLLDISGASATSRVKNVSFKGLTFAHTDYNLQKVGESRGKASVQGATIYIAYGSGDWHSSKYQIIDTLPGMINVNNAESISFFGNTIKHGGAEGVAMTNDVVNSQLVGNFIRDTAGSAITVGHPQHISIGDGGAREKYQPGIEGLCTGNTISNNVLYDISMQPGFGGHSGITAFFVTNLAITHNHIQKTAYNGLNLGWGWRNFTSSTTAKDNSVLNNRFIDTLSRLHDSGAIYTIGQNPGTKINENYVKGIPPATSGPTYGLHNDEGSAFIVENDNVLDIDPGVKYTINSEDFGAKHDLTILRTYATVNKMGATPPNSRIDPPVAVSDNVWPLAQYAICLKAGLEDSYRLVLPTSLLAQQDFVFPASCAAPTGTSSIPVRSSGSASLVMWFAPAGTTSFAEGAKMTKATGLSTTIAAPSAQGTYKLHLVDAGGTKLGESIAQLRIGGR